MTNVRALRGFIKIYTRFECFTLFSARFAQMLPVLHFKFKIIANFSQFSQFTPIFTLLASNAKCVSPTINFGFTPLLSSKAHLAIKFTLFMLSKKHLRHYRTVKKVLKCTQESPPTATIQLAKNAKASGDPPPEPPELPSRAPLKGPWTPRRFVCPTNVRNVDTRL